MNILAIEFSSPQRSIAVVQGGGAQVSAGPDQQRAGELPAGISSTDAGRNSGTMSRISEVVETGRSGNALGMVEAALREANIEREQIECIALGIGPGSYTGIRSAIALAQGWQIAFPAIRLLAIGTAECIAAQARTDGLAGSVTIAIDAQRGEFYLANYDIGPEGIRQTKPLRLAAKSEVDADQTSGSQLIGPEITKWFPEGRLIFPRAAALGQLALHRSDFVSGEKIEPIYLRETTFTKAPPPRSPIGVAEAPSPQPSPQGRRSDSDRLPS